MPAVSVDRQGIERRDFPVSRRGYDPAAVDAHLRALASEFEEQTTALAWCDQLRHLDGVAARRRCSFIVRKNRLTTMRG